MAHFVYLPKIQSNTWLHWTMRGNGSCIRDFSQLPAREIRKFSRHEIEELLSHEGAMREPAPSVAYTNGRYWHDRIRLLNIESHLIEPNLRERLLNSFKQQVEQALDNGVAGLRGVLGFWRTRLRIAVEKRVVLNHWDIDDAKGKITPNTGLGWTSQMLEFCRRDRNPNFMKAGRISIFFAAMELSIGISSRRNPFTPGSVNSIRMDGLGVCSDYSVAVLEVKGPQDDLNPWSAILQGVLGGLAVHAKRDYILKLLRSESGLRPGILNVCIPDQRPSIRVYVLLSSVDSRQRVVKCDLGQRSKQVLDLVRASGVIEEVALFRIPLAMHNNLVSLPDPEVIWSCRREHSPNP